MEVVSEPLNPCNHIQVIWIVLSNLFPFVSLRDVLEVRAGPFDKVCQGILLFPHGLLGCISQKAENKISDAPHNHWLFPG